MEMLLGFIVLILCLLVGVRHGGLGLAAVIAFITSKLVNSQGAAIAIVVPMALNVGLDPVLVLSFISACYGYFFLPTYPSDLACIGFDRSGTTRIGKFILNHSFMIPGLIGVVTGCCVGYVVAHLVL